MAFYNTTHEKGDELKKAWDTAESQDDLIYRMFKAYAVLTPWIVYGKLWKRNGRKEVFPITSIRRTFNTLMKQGKIRKTNDKRISPHSGRSEYIYHIVR